MLYRNDQTQSWFLARELPLTYPKLYYKEIQVHVSSKIRVLPSWTLVQTLDLNFAMASRYCRLAVAKFKFGVVNKLVDGRARRGWMHKVYYTLVKCNLLPPLYLDLFLFRYTTCSDTVVKQLAKF